MSYSLDYQLIEFCCDPTTRRSPQFYEDFLSLRRRDSSAKYGISRLSTITLV
jgi:hypothetical protein